MSRKHRWFPLLLCLALLPHAFADDLQLDTGGTGLYLRLKQLQSPISVLHVVAHPDDEDGAMLAYCARELGVRTVLFSLTRGEGGANLISNHFFDELGALRTLEHAKAASYYGNALFYSRAADYGYSKSLEEAMKKWQNGSPLLEQLVEVIRRERPSILLSRFAGDARDGHGHHQMAGVLSRQAFDDAADPNAFPEQIRDGLEPWQIKKFYVRAGSPWRPPQPEDWTVALPVGIRNPVIGRSPAQVARFGLGFQRSQGFSGHAADPGPQSTYYRLERRSEGTVPTKETTLLDGLDTTWSGLIPEGSVSSLKQNLKGIDEQLRDALDHWDPRSPEATLKSLLALPKTDEMLDANLPAGIMKDLASLPPRIQRTVEFASGVEVTAWATTVDDQPINFVVPGEEVKVTTRIANQSNAVVQAAENVIRWESYQSPPEKTETSQPASLNRSSTQEPVSNTHSLAIEEDIAPGDVLEVTQTFRLPADTRLTRPFWSRPDITETMYRLEERESARMPRRESRIHATPRLVMQLPDDAPQDASNTTSHTNTRTVPLAPPTLVHVRRSDPEFGNVRYPLAIVPDKSVRFDLANRVLRRDQKTFTTSIVVRNSAKQPNSASVQLDVPSSWTCIPAKQEVSFLREDEERQVPFQITIPANVGEQAFHLRAIVTSDTGQYTEGFETVTARDLGRMNVYHDASQRVQVIDVQVQGEPNVGYIAGSGDRVAESLAPLNVYPTMLSDADLASADLSQFDVILVGVRAYAVREGIRTHNARLLEYVQRGGVLIVQYQTPEFDYNFGPYPYSMGRGPEEVSEEDAPVTILQPDHPLFQSPNRITPRDFDGWFEQRGSKFWRSWDPQYVALLSCHDQGQSPQEGGQLIARFGNGVYVYSAYAWYRQLPRGVPGAYRLFANLLSLPTTELVH